MKRAALRTLAAAFARTAQSTTIRFEQRRETGVTLLNAARVRGLAARAAVAEQESGFRVDPAIPNLPAIAWKEIERQREKAGIPAVVTSIEYDPNRSARIALINYADGALATDDLEFGCQRLDAPAAARRARE